MQTYLLQTHLVHSQNAFYMGFSWLPRPSHLKLTWTTLLYPSWNCQKFATSLYIVVRRCRVYTRTHVAGKHVSRTSNMYSDTYNYVDGNVSPDTSCLFGIQCWEYMLTVSRLRHNYYSFMSRSTCILLYPATDGRQTGDNFVADTRSMLTTTSGYNLYPVTCVLV